MSNRKFGVEIEFIFYGDIHGVAAKLNEYGVTTVVEGYNHQTRTHWKIVHDASCGWELVSPPMSGESGLEEIRKACRALVDSGARVNRRCGLHVHVDANGLSVEAVKTICRRYVKFGQEIDSFMPASRRANNNVYCRNNDAALYDRNFNSIYDMAYHEGRSDGNARYKKVNIQSYLRHGTVEFRQHSGTTNGSKICNWVRFCLGFVEKSIELAELANNNSNTINPVSQPGALTSIRALNGMNAVAVVLCHTYVNFSAMSIDEIAEFTGLAHTSIRLYLSKLRQKGYRITHIRGAGYRMTRLVMEHYDPVRRYYDAHGVETEINNRRDRRLEANNQHTEAAATASVVVEDSLFNGIDADVVAFYEERREEFAA